MQRKVAGSALKYRIWERSRDSPVDNYVTNVITSGDICQILATTLGISHFLLTPASWLGSGLATGASSFLAMVQDVPSKGFRRVTRRVGWRPS